MIIVDRALAARAEAGKPIRVGLIGAGFQGRAIARQLLTAVPGIDLVAIANRTLPRARQAFTDCGVEDVDAVDSVHALERTIARDRHAVTDNPDAVCESGTIEVVIEATGTIEHACRSVVRAIDGGKHVVLVNAELDATLGPVLKVRADRAGRIITNCDGDQPAVQMNLYRFAKSIGMTPLLCASMKGLLDPYRTPETQASFARRVGQSPVAVTSYADGTKLSFEQAVVANAAAMRVATRGMRGYAYDGYVDEPGHLALYDVDELRELGGIVDYVLGAKPNAGVLVLCAHDDSFHHSYLELYKLGPGPLYCLYTPYHLCHLEVPHSIARAVLFGDAAIAPTAGPAVQVVATAKRDLKAGEAIDGIGGYMTFGQCENADVARALRLLPMGLAEDCRLTRNVRRDEVLTYDDVEIPGGRLSDALWSEQESLFGAERAAIDG
jgi:predicted homoserine dehydrogenase-like protein